MLSAVTGRLLGCMTHYDRRRTVYCDPALCVGPLHRTQRYWKGYVAAEVYQQEEELWSPVCLEITEHLELDMREVYARGQVWEISRLPSIKGKHWPVTGVLLEERDPKTFPTAFELVPCLLHLYHVDQIELNVPNPLPARTLVAPSRGEPPAFGRRPASSAAPGFDKTAANQQLRELLEQRKKPFVPVNDGKAGKNGTNGTAGKT